MSNSPQVLVDHNFPPETAGTLDEFVSEIRNRLPTIDLCRATNYQETVEQIPAADIVVEHGFSEELLDHAEELKWIHTLSSGADFYDLNTVKDLGAILTTVSGVHAKPIAEHVFALMLFFERRMFKSRVQQERHEWQRFPAGELGNQTLGIIGVGSIGSQIAELGSAFGMDVLGVRRKSSKNHKNVDEMFDPDNRHELLGRSDYVVLACPLTEKTRGLIGKKEISSMKSDAVLVNVARGEIVDQDSLIEQLQTGYLGGAALDVTETEPLPQNSPLWDMSNVIITPHMAGGSPHFPERCAEIFTDNYNYFVDGSLDDMRNRVI